MLIEINRIIVGEDRIRREFDPRKMDQLKDSIHKLGLMHPIVVDSVDAEGNYKLRCGERRLRAITKLHQEDAVFLFEDLPVPPGYIPTTFLSELSDEQRLEAELEENTHRVNLSWQEETRAQARLHEFRLSQNPKQTFKQTAVEIAGDRVNSQKEADISRNVFLAKHLDDPEVANAKSHKEAFNIASRKAAAVFEAKLAEITKGKISKTGHTLIHGDSREELVNLFKQPERFDVIVTDPPYGIGADGFDTMSDSNSGLDHEYDDTPEYAFSCYEAVACYGYGLCKENAHAYIFFDMRHYGKLCEIFAAAGWDVYPYPIIWDKTTGMLGDSTRKPRRTYETILFCTKGDKRVTGVYNDVVRIPQHGAKLHAAEKPVDLYVDLLHRSCIPGDNVLDPFVGSGTLFPAATKLALRATGIEKSATSHNIAATRVVERA